MSTTSLREALRLVESELAGQRWQSALTQTEKLLVIHPRWLDALRVKADILIALNQLPEAEEIIDGILAAHPEHVPAFIARAQIAAHRRDLAAILACYRRICEMTSPNMQWRVSYNQIAQQLQLPPYTPSHSGLARLYLRSELYVQSFKEWQIALNANSTRVDAMVGVAETLWRMRNFARAKEMCSFILQRHPHVLKAVLLMAFFEAEAGHLDDARQLIYDAASMDPEQTIAGSLFIDYVAVGHQILTDLFRQTARSLTRPVAAASIVQLPPAPPPELPRTTTDPLPDGQLKTGPLFAKTATLRNQDSINTSTNTTSQTGDLAKQHQLEDYFSQSRASQVAPEFAQIFKETENMLWDPRGDADSSQELPALVHVPPPPALAAAMAAATQTDETERNFIQWLHSQGAVSLDGELPITSDNPAMFSQVAMPPFLQQAMSTNDVPTSAEPSPAISEPAVNEEQRVVVPSLSLRSKPTDAHTSSPESLSDVSQNPSMQASSVAIPSSSSGTIDGNASAVTIEAIEEGLVSAGFSPMETGRLSSISSHDHNDASRERTPQERMDEARHMRREGRVGEALLEYHILVKTSDDLADVIRDLRDTAIEDPYEPEIHRLLGDAFIRQGNYIEALEAYNQSSYLRQSARG